MHYLFEHYVFFEGSRRPILLVPERSAREKSAWVLTMLKRWFQRVCLRRKYNVKIDAEQKEQIYSLVTIA